jgi:hypothetical protein
MDVRLLRSIFCSSSLSSVVAAVFWVDDYASLSGNTLSGAAFYAAGSLLAGICAATLVVSPCVRAYYVHNFMLLYLNVRT